MKVILFGNIHQARKNLYVEAVVKKLRALGIGVWVESRFARFITEQMGIDPDGLYVTDEIPTEADLALSMGGDGTFLGTAARVGNTGLPILGINTGHLGFLADASPDCIDEALEMLQQGAYKVEQHTLLEVSKDGQPLLTYPYALNEVAVLKHDISSLIEIRTLVNGELLANYMADGLIVCTPTGSTGYSLSVGGPIIEPRSGSFCISPVAPHSLTSRPVILCDDVEITLIVKSRSHNFLISIDGRSDSYADGTALTLRRAPYTIGVVKVKHQLFFDTLREKMMWGLGGRT